AATATATAAEATTTAATAAVLPGLGLIDRQAAAVHLFAVHRGDGGLRLLVGAHFDEAKALGTAGVAVHDDLGGLDRAVRREHLFEVAVGHAVGQVPDVQLPAHPAPLQLLWGDLTGSGKPRCEPAREIATGGLYPV